MDDAELCYASAAGLAARAVVIPGLSVRRLRPAVVSAAVAAWATRKPAIRLATIQAGLRSRTRSAFLAKVPGGELTWRVHRRRLTRCGRVAAYGPLARSAASG